MKASSEKTSVTTTPSAAQAEHKPFFAKAGGGDFFSSSTRTPPFVQMKLTVNKVGDKYEQEADKMADKVMRMPAPSETRKIQRQPEEKIQKKEDDKIQKAPANEDKLQRFSNQTPPDVSAKSQSSIQSKKASGQPLPEEVRGFMEPRFGADFSKVRVHHDAEAGALSNQLSARAFTHENHVFFSNGQYQPGTSEGRQLLAHELTHTVQQGHAIQRSPQITTTTTPPPIQRLGVQNILDKFAEWANHIPGFRMLTIVMGINPINMRSVDRNAANILRAMIEIMPGGHLITQALDNHGVFAKAGAWIDRQLAMLGNIGGDLVAAIKRFVNDLKLSDAWDLGGVWERAKLLFTSPIAKLTSFAISAAVGILKLIKDAVLLPLAKLAEGTKGYDLLKAILGQDPVTGDAVPRTADTLIGGFMKLIGQEEVWENIKKGKAIQRAWAWFQGALSGLMGFVQAIPKKVVTTITSLTIQDVLTVTGAFVKVAGAFANIATAFFSWAFKQVLSLLEILFSVVAPGVMPYIKKAQAAFSTIIKNPIGFVNNLVRAGKRGFELFAGNILTHLKTALIKWITGPLGEAGVYIPTSFSLMEIIKLVLSVLGLTWQNIRSKLVKIIPEPVLVALEKTAGILVTLVKDGPAAAWEQIKTELTELKGQLIGQVTAMISGEVVKAAVTKLVSMLNPAGAVIQAIIAIYNTVTFFIQKINQIASVVASFIDSIAAIAAGQVENAAKKVELTMANTLTVIIAFLAKFVGLGNVPNKLVAIVKKIRKPIDAGLDKIVAWLGSILKKAGDALFGKNKDDKRSDEQKEKAVDSACKEVAAYTKSTKVNFIKLRLKLNSVKSKYQLTSITAEKISKDKYKIDAVINPRKGTEVEIDDDPNGLPSGAKEPVVKFTAKSHSGNTRTYCKDSDAKVWFWNEGKSAWQVTSDDKKLLEAEKAANNWLVENNSTFISLVEDDKKLSDSGFDQLGIQVNPTTNQDEVVIGDTKGAFGKSVIYFTYKGVRSGRDNPFSATTTNLPANILAARESTKIARDTVKRVDAALIAGNIKIIYFLAGKAKISEATLLKVHAMVKKNLISLLKNPPYSLTAEDAKSTLKDVAKPTTRSL